MVVFESEAKTTSEACAPVETPEAKADPAVGGLPFASQYVLFPLLVVTGIFHWTYSLSSAGKGH